MTIIFRSISITFFFDAVVFSEGPPKISINVFRRVPSPIRANVKYPPTYLLLSITTAAMFSTVFPTLRPHKDTSLSSVPSFCKHNIVCHSCLSSSHQTRSQRPLRILCWDRYRSKHYCSWWSGYRLLIPLWVMNRSPLQSHYLTPPGDSHLWCSLLPVGITLQSTRPWCQPLLFWWLWHRQSWWPPSTVVLSGPHQLPPPLPWLK